MYKDDKTLVGKMIKGDQRSFNDFFEEYYDRLYRFSMTRLSDDPDAAADVVQQTLTKAIHNLTSYKGEAQLFTWLCAICRNETSDWLKKNVRYREHIKLVEDGEAIKAAVESLKIPVNDEPEQQALLDDRKRLIHVALDQLPKKYGDALEWKYIKGFSVSEIAEKLDIGNEAAQSLLARARNAFADVYQILLNGTDNVIPLEK